jgi:hypothetical protein
MLLHRLRLVVLLVLLFVGIEPTVAPSAAAPIIQLSGPRIFVEPAAEELTGLTFPSNTGVAGDSIRFHFATPPPIEPITLLWKINPSSGTAGYRTTFFWGHQGGEVVFADPQGGYYFGCHPYPPGGSSGTSWNWEIAIQQGDKITDANANDTAVVHDQWYSQACVSDEVTTDELRVRFYWNVAVNLNRLIEYDTTVDGPASTYLAGASPDGEPDNPGIFFGDAPWSGGNEMLSGTLRGIIIVATNLNTTHIAALLALDTDAEVISYATANSLTIWYCNMNPTPSDISDKCGAGNNPSWANANRPTLWTGSIMPANDPIWERDDALAA